MGLEDAIFAAQGIGSSLANAVISSSAAAAASSSSSTSPSEATVVFDVLDSVKSLAALYIAGLWTSFSPCSLGLLPITVSYISNAVNNVDDRDDDGKMDTIVPTLSYAAGLATVFTALGVSASALGGVFGGNGGDGGGWSALALSAVASLVSVLMGLQLLELIRLPLPSLDFRLRRTAMAYEGGGRRRRRGGGSNDGGNGSLFDENGGLVLGATGGVVDGVGADEEDDDDGNGYDVASVLLRTFLLGGTSALVASPCATPVLTSLLAYMASASSSSSSAMASGDVWRGASWMLSYTLGYSTPLLVAGATGGQALVNLRRARNNGGGGGLSSISASLGRWVNPLTGGVLISFGMNGLLVALLGDPSVIALAPIID
jgi:cytochrome c-type biogenesis protein